MEFVNPKKILNQLELSSDMVAADFGCGSGGWVMPLATTLKDGKIFAIDVQESALSALEGKMRMQNIVNIHKILADVEKKIVEIEDESCDLVLVTDLLFQIDDKEAVFEEVKRVLKMEGKVLVVEWSFESEIGPKENKISPDEVESLANKFSLFALKDFKAGDYHYALLLEKR